MLCTQFRDLTKKEAFFVKILKMSATFGALENKTLTLSDGLNIIEAPNESGKSTWCAFLRVMLYGLATRERGALADKNRYAPWSGSAMQGRIDLCAGGDLITITRDTARANAPMGRFRAVYTGTEDAVPSLTGENCGETLLGVGREIFTRSAFIRQSGIAVDHDAELERRIASLITSGEEDTSFSEAQRRLKDALNHRRLNSRMGLLPELGRSIDEIDLQLSHLNVLQDRLADAQRSLDTLRETAQDEGEALPPRDVLFDARAALRAAEPLRRTQEEASRQLEKAHEEREAAAAQVEAHALSKHTSEELDGLRRTHEETAQKKSFPILTLLILLVGLAFAGLGIAAHIPYIYIALHIITYLAAAFGTFFHARRQEKDAQSAAARERAAFEQEVEELAALRDALRRAEGVQNAAKNALDAQEASLADCISHALRLLAPYHAAADEKDAETFIEHALHRCDARENAEREREMRINEATREVDLLRGQLASFPPADELSAARETLFERQGKAQDEYDAIALAMETLERANTTLQTRFSPDLGRRTSEIFAALTGGRYESVTLDRTLAAHAAQAGESVAHDAQLLSCGAYDQLYLAVRLAICEMVLGKDGRVPLILDDALTNFDDERMRRALDLLTEAAKTRQVILFTCQSRESLHFHGHKGINLCRL